MDGRGTSQLPSPSRPLCAAASTKNAKQIWCNTPPIAAGKPLPCYITHPAAPRNPQLAAKGVPPSAGKARCIHTASSPTFAAPAAGVAAAAVAGEPNRSALLSALVVVALVRPPSPVSPLSELFRGSDGGSRLDLHRGHQEWPGPSNQASMHCACSQKEGNGNKSSGESGCIPRQVGPSRYRCTAVHAVRRCREDNKGLKRDQNENSPKHAAIHCEGRKTSGSSRKSRK